MLSSDFNQWLARELHNNNQILDFNIYIGYEEAGEVDQNYIKENFSVYSFEEVPSPFQSMFMRESIIEVGNDHATVVAKTASKGYITELILFAGIIIYWVLFTIWAVINAYHKQRVNIGWILLFAIFNIIGYGIYRLAEGKDSKR